MENNLPKEPICFECEKPLPEKKYHLTYCSKKCYMVKKGQCDRTRSEEGSMQSLMYKARWGDTDAQKILRDEYGVRGLLRGSGYLTAKEAEENTVRF